MRSEHRIHTSSSPKPRRRRFLRVALLGLAVLPLLGGECDPKGPDFFNPFGGLDPFTGDIFGTVTVDGTPRSGVTVTARRNGMVVATQTTDAQGRYEFLELDPGSYTVSISTITGVDCPGEQTATVIQNDETQVNFTCTTPQPQTGTVTGTVTANNAPVVGAIVALDGRTATTDANGAFTVMDVAPGSYSVNATATGFQCGAQTTTVTAGQTSTVTITCMAVPPTGSEIAAVQYSLAGTISGTDGCGLGMTISNPGPITTRFDPATNTLVIESDADVAGTLVPGQPWMGTGETTFSSNNITFTLRESVSGTWMREGGLIGLNGSLLFEIFDQTFKVCESRYDASYQQLVASSHRFKTGIVYLLPDGASILGLRPAAFRYRAPFGEPSIPRLGLIAEDVAGVFPGAIARDSTGRPLGIAYGILHRLVVEEASGRVARMLDSLLEDIGRPARE